MSTVERRFVATDNAVGIEERAGEPSKITGYASVFYDGSRGTEYELWEGVSERIDPKAFDRVLADGEDVAALFNHDPNQLLGRRSAGTLKLEVFSKGLRYTIPAEDTQASRDVLYNIRKGNLNGSSFSFTVAKERWDKTPTGEVRTIEEVGRLLDVGPVTHPAYSGTSTGVRSAGDIVEARSSYDAWKAAQVPVEITEERVEEVATLSPEEVLERLASYAKRAAELEA